MNRVRRIVQEQKEIAKKAEEKKETRLKRLHDFGRVNELIYTKDGVYEIDGYRHPICQTSVRSNSREGIPKTKKSKKKKRRQFRVEKVKISARL